MDSSSSRTEEEKRRQENILKQIAELQAQLKDVPPIALSALVQLPQSPKRKEPISSTFVPPTPSPKKRKLHHRPLPGVSTTHPSQPTRGTAQPPQASKHGPNGVSSKKTEEPQFSRPSPSNLLNNLARVNHKQHNSERTTTNTRSSGFGEIPAPTTHEGEGDTLGDSSTGKRDDRLALIEDLEPGPVKHIPSVDDPDFQRLEPNSGIRLSSRTVSHEDLQDHLTGRYYLSPSQLYSSIRLLPDKTAYDIPVCGDWVTIAVVAERGPMKFSKAPVTISHEEDDRTDKKEHWKKKGKESLNEGNGKPTGKKYVNIKLIDFGTRSRSSSSATGGKAVLRGDAFLSLLLFESDSFDLMTEEGATKPRKIYRGGSRGAFETMSRLKEGDVVALLNPRLLKPYQRSNDSPHPTNNILAITPESAASIMGIGRARDLGMCSVMKKDNTICGSWVDKRVSDVCEYHVQHAVERRRAGRAEFSIGTTGLSTSAAPKRKPVYDPARQWGLKPEDSSGSATYIVSGHVVNDSKADSRSLFATENIGREGQAKAARKLSGQDADRALTSLLKRDKEGMKAVMKAREVGSDGGDMAAKGNASKGKGKEKERAKRNGNRVVEVASSESTSVATKNAYTAGMIKQLGFDPIAMAGQKRGTSDLDVQKKLRSLHALQSSRKVINLAPRPGQRIRSGVIAPSATIVAPKMCSGNERSKLRDMDTSDDDEMPADPSGHIHNTLNHLGMMVDLDSDD